MVAYLIGSILPSWLRVFTFIGSSVDEAESAGISVCVWEWEKVCQTVCYEGINMQIGLERSTQRQCLLPQRGFMLPTTGPKWAESRNVGLAYTFEYNAVRISYEDRKAHGTRYYPYCLFFGLIVTLGLSA
mmetsp:Transcript_26499/g.78419  ORF Transcript_26499/g.78419 Transcript_26499/m.78419 type:complete len:130 (-) Transcript_26499:199-588(-)